MKIRTFYVAAATAIAAIAVPAAAQTAYPYGYQQSYPQYQQPQAYPGYAQPTYGYDQGYTQGYGQSSSPVASIINSLLGNRYSVSDRTAVSQCANAAMIQAQNQYRGYSYGRSSYGYQPSTAYGYGQPGYGQGVAAPAMRVTAITDVQRRNSGLRVKGLMSSGYGAYGNPYANQYGYNQNRNYAAGDVSFRCNVDYRGTVTGLKISANNSAFRRY